MSPIKVILLLHLMQSGPAICQLRHFHGSVGLDSPRYAGDHDE